jgi:5'-nucleotidase (lipoprotein e(P4) family)
MRKLLGSFCIATLALSTCLGQVKKEPCRCPLDSVRGDKESVLAILYQQRAAEYTALCLQAYNLAKRKVDEALASPILLKDDLPLAVITDLDETALDNSANEVHQYLRDSAYNGKEFNRWIMSMQAGAVPGALQFFTYVDSLSAHGSKKIDIYYISNRDASMVSYTMTNMKNLGFPQCDDTAHFKFKATASSSKESRRQAVLQDHQVVVLLGDNLIDLDAHFDGWQQTPDQRMDQVYKLKDKWGDLYIVLPNADYGDWESYLYYQYRHDHQGIPPGNMNTIEQQRKDMLKASEKPF